MIKQMFVAWVCFLTLPLWAASNGATELTLEEAVSLAVEQSPLSQRIEAEREVSRSAFFTILSTVLPQINLFTGFTRTGPHTDMIIDIPDEPPIPTEEFSIDQYQVGFNLNQVLFDGPALLQITRLGAVEDIADLSFRASNAELAMNVKQIYFNLIVVNNNVLVAEAAVEQSEEQLEIAQELLRLGVITRPDLLRVQVALTQQRVELIDARRALENGLRNLGNLLSIREPVAIDTVLAFPDTLAPLPSLDSLINLALERNPSYRISNIALENQRSAELSARLQRLPTLTGSFTYGYAAPFLFSNLDEWAENDFYNFGIQMNIPIFEGTRWRGQLQESTAQRRIAENDLEIVRINLIEQMQAAHSDLEATHETLLLIPSLLQAAQEEFRLTQEQFRLGVISSFELLQSQVALREAQLQSVAIITNYYLAEAQIQMILGDW
ncbi:TolC family protein [Chitinispirillales bacterium ANBcel5]|uniref:TolC family protein n=1 Tax=Cellulosispirillum alkaliphilum TaxID=3039283 RepID=UPI002A534BC3|nr:TolC family protein [Chitinispirillales bacterium ANBcel5]